MVTFFCILPPWYDFSDMILITNLPSVIMTVNSSLPPIDVFPWGFSLTSEKFFALGHHLDKGLHATILENQPYNEDYFSQS